MSLPNLEELEPGTPEWEAAVDAAQDEEDRATGNVEVPPEGEGDEPTQAAEPEAEPTAAVATEPDHEQQPAAEPAKEAKPTGVLSKDGTRVLPYGALKGAREETQAERKARLAAEQERDALRQELADLKAGKKPSSEDGDDMTPEQLQEIVTDFPALAPLVNKVKKADEMLRQVTARSQPTATQQEEQDQSDDPLQTAIDSVPMLAGWQGEKGPQWKRAIELDKAFEHSPKWKDKPLAERFAHVTKLVADEFDIQIEDDTPSQQTTQARVKTDPAQVVKGAQRANPNTLSDFKGGAPDPSRDSLDRMPAARALNRVSEMSDDEIEKWLAKNGG